MTIYFEFQGIFFDYSLCGVGRREGFHVQCSILDGTNACTYSVLSMEVENIT
jgi:hypothetical protein